MEQWPNQPNTSAKKRRLALVGGIGILGAVITWVLASTDNALQIREQLQRQFGYAANRSVDVAKRDSLSIPCVQQNLSVIPAGFVSDLRQQVPMLTLVMWGVNFDKDDVVVTTLAVSNFSVSSGDHSVEIPAGIVDTRRQVIGSHNEQPYLIAQALDAYQGAFNALPDATVYVASLDVVVYGHRANMAAVEYSCPHMRVRGTIYRR